MKLRWINNVQEARNHAGHAARQLRETLEHCSPLEVRAVNAALRTADALSRDLEALASDLRAEESEAK